MFSGLLLTVAGCAAPPDPGDGSAPDVAPLVAEYARPEGTIDPAHPSAWLATAEAKLALFGDGALDLTVNALLSAALAQVDQSTIWSTTSLGVRTRLDGIATADVKCGDDGDDRASLSVAVRDGKLAPLVWGSAHECVLWRSGKDVVRLDGALALYRYVGEDFLLRVEGSLSLFPGTLAFDFQLVGGRVEVRLATETGTIVVAREGTKILARGANGTFACDVAKRACS